uniref:Uncharacterized protein n=1 Tax=Clytia hemisphaerica TaxID=252671 RepID=A0A7M5XE38_9CNID
MATGSVGVNQLELDGNIKFAVIRDLYNTKDESDKQFTRRILEEQLESSLESQLSYIIVEPKGIGDETIKWIAVGNFLHKSAVLSGLTCLLLPIITPKRFKMYVIVPLFSLNTLCTLLYNLSWQFDPCCKYQIEKDDNRLEQLHLETLATTSPVVLVHRDDKYRKRLHNIISVLVLSYAGWKCFWYYKS